MMDSSEIREALTGPVASLKTPFQRDGKIDEKGLSNLIDYSINYIKKKEGEKPGF